MSYCPPRCQVCNRVRLASGDWLVTDVTYPNEVAGCLCPMCRVTLEANRELGRKLRDRAARRDRRRGRTYPATGDPFAGFKGE